MRSVLLVLLVAVLGGCSNSTSAGNIEGRWSQEGQMPGSSTTMTLNKIGSIVSGSGEWCGEALRCGTLTVRGTAQADAIHLEITFDQNGGEIFDGRLEGSDALVGTAKWFVGIPEAFEVRFIRE